MEITKDNMMRVNLHTHTARCNHAEGTEAEYVENAVKAGLKCLGFSAHTPYVFKDGHYSGFRMKPEEQEDYVNTVLALKEKYKGIIDIKLGYETEYYPDLFEDYKNLIKDYPIEYLILGQHFIDNETTGINSHRETDVKEYLEKYINEVCEGIKTGLFTYVAHPELMDYILDEKYNRESYKKIIETAIECDVPLEINLLGIREHRHYPHDWFFEMCGRMGAKVVIGSDAHAPDVVFDKESYIKALEMAEKYKLNLILEPEIKKVNI